MKLETPDERIQSIQRRVEDDLKDHQVTVVADADSVHCWKCAKTGTWNYGFFVSAIPGFVIVAGDIGELMFEPTHPNPVDFCLVDDLHYQYGKVVNEFRNQKTVLPYLVKDALSLVVTNFRERRRKLPIDLVDLCRDMREVGYKPDNLDDFYQRMMDIDPDSEIAYVTVPTHGVIYRIFALQWFGRWLAQQQHEATAA